jgi:hypothetical protein
MPSWLGGSERRQRRPHNQCRTEQVDYYVCAVARLVVLTSLLVVHLTPDTPQLTQMIPVLRGRGRGGRGVALTGIYEPDYDVRFCVHIFHQVYFAHDQPREARAQAVCPLFKRYIILLALGRLET